MCDRCRPTSPGWALLFAMAMGTALWGVIGLVVWAVWPVSAWVVLGLLIGIVACNLPVFR